MLIIHLFNPCAKLFKKIFLPSKFLKTAKNYNFFHVYGGYFELSSPLCFQFFPYASNLPHFPKFPNRPPSLSLFVALIEKNTSLTSTFTSTSTPQKHLTNTYPHHSQSYPQPIKIYPHFIHIPSIPYSYSHPHLTIHPNLTIYTPTFLSSLITFLRNLFTSYNLIYLPNLLPFQPSTPRLKLPIYFLTL